MEINSSGRAILYLQLEMNFPQRKRQSVINLDATVGSGNAVPKRPVATQSEKATGFSEQFLEWYLMTEALRNPVLAMNPAIGGKRPGSHRKEFDFSPNSRSFFLGGGGAKERLSTPKGHTTIEASDRLYIFLPWGRGSPCAPQCVFRGVAARLLHEDSAWDTFGLPVLPDVMSNTSGASPSVSGDLTLQTTRSYSRLTGKRVERFFCVQCSFPQP